MFLVVFIGMYRGMGKLYGNLGAARGWKGQMRAWFTIYDPIWKFMILIRKIQS